MALTYTQLAQQLKAATYGIEPDNNKIFERKLALIQKWLQKNLLNSNRKIDELNKSLEVSQNWQQVAHEAVLLQAHLYRWKKGLKSISVEDWENDGKERTITLDPMLTASEEIQQRVRQSKKLHLSLPHLEREIKKAEKRRDTLIDLLEQFKNLDKEENLDPFLGKVRSNLGLQEPGTQKSEIVKKEKARRPFHEFISDAGILIWVGKKATDNDKLTFSHANGDDYWLHASGFPGSHVVIRGKKGQNLDQETLQDALQLAMTYSKAKSSSDCEVVFTQCKYITRYGKNSPGKVQVSKHQLLHVRSSEERLKTIKQRKV